MKDHHFPHFHYRRLCWWFSSLLPNAIHFLILTPRCFFISNPSPFTKTNYFQIIFQRCICTPPLLTISYPFLDSFIFIFQLWLNLTLSCGKTLKVVISLHAFLTSTSSRQIKSGYLTNIILSTYFSQLCQISLFNSQ